MKNFLSNLTDTQKLAFFDVFPIFQKIIERFEKAKGFTITTKEMQSFTVFFNTIGLDSLDSIDSASNEIGNDKSESKLTQFINSIADDYKTFQQSDNILDSKTIK